MAEALFVDVPVKDISAYHQDPTGYTLRAAWQDFLLAWPWATVGTVLWIDLSLFQT